MIIRYKGEVVEVEYINDDPLDEDMDLCVRFPIGHPMRDPDDTVNDGTVWIHSTDYEIIEG
jgi:hypothetical protein